MARSAWKFQYFSKKVWTIIFLKKRAQGLKKFYKIFSRGSTIPDCFDKLIVLIHKGKKYRVLKLNRHVIGYKFGEFAMTRKPFHFPIRKRKGRNFIRR